MCRFLIACMFMSYSFSSESFGQSADLDKIKSAIHAIKDNSGKRSFNFQNSLNGINFSEYASRAYLYYYRALGSYQIAMNKRGEERLKWLEQILDDLQQARNSPAVEQTKSLDLSLQVQKERVETAFELQKYTIVINAIEKLPLKEQKDLQIVFYYAQALFLSHQMSLFSSLAKKYLAELSDKELLKKMLPKKPNWDDALAEIANTALPLRAKKNVGTSSQLDPTPEELLEKPAEFLTLITDHFYLSDAEKTYKQFVKLYFSLERKTEFSVKERDFLITFQKTMPFLAPAFLEDTINKLWKNRQLNLAENLSEVFLKNFLGHPSYPKVLYNLGRIQEDEHDYNKASQSYRRFLEISDDATMAEYATFRLAWVSYLGKDNKTAETFFNRYVQDYPSGHYASTCEYFLLKIADFSVEPKLENRQKDYSNYARKYPLNIYSLLLLDEWGLPYESLLNVLSEADQPDELKKRYKIFKADVATLTNLKIYGELYNFEMFDEASKFLMSTVFDENNDSLLVHLTGEFAKLNYTYGEDLSLIKLLNTVPQVRSQIPWKRLFPNFQIDMIKKILREQGSTLSPYVVLSIIRQESVFNVEAHSSANAFGLMQLTMPTANISAKNLGINHFSLLSEEDNIRLGIKTFDDLLRKFQNRLDLALSAYNAGETATQFWLDLNGDLAPIEFIESIPYQETRQYVKSILRNYAIYRLLYEDKASPLVSYIFST